MIAAFSMDNLPLGWFDVALVGVLAFGLFRGRKNGMTKEVLPTVEWLILIVAAGLAYGMVAKFYSGTCGLSKLWSAVLGYVSIAVAILIIFSAIKKVLVPKLTGSNIFGNAEYYMGMPSGMIRYGCILIFALALLNARFYSAADIAQKKAYNEKWYGGGIYSGDYVPDIHTAQEAVFKKSFTGPYIKSYMGVLLIQTGPGDADGAQPQKKPQPIIHIGN